MHRPICTPSRVATFGLWITLITVGTDDARAGNTEHPRTPVLWPDAPCIQTVTRSVDPLFAFGYQIPAEDTALSFDEFADSRRHQFIALCRQYTAGAPPPIYVSLADLQRSVEAGFDDPALLDEPESTLETSLVWAGCWRRVTPDDARRPITEAAAAAPVLWDTSEVPPGTWMIAGYTWEPPYNIWRRAPWVLRVIDGDDPPVPVQAAATLGDTPQVLWSDETLDLPCCIDAPAQSTLRFQWRDSKGAVDWSELSQVVIEGDGPQALTLPFAPPEASWGETVQLRALVEHASAEPLDYVAHALSPVIAIERDNSGDTDTDTDTGTGTGTGGDTDTSGDFDPADEDSGSTGGANPSHSQAGAGRCSLQPERGNLPLLACGLAMLLLGLRRTRTPDDPRP